MKSGELETLFGAGLAGLGPERRATAWSVEEIDKAVAGLGMPAGRARDVLGALALLWHDHLDAGHARVQDLPGADAAFVHGIMHRREPDYGNARYWFHRVGAHPAFEDLADVAAPILAERPALPHRLIREGRWDSFAFVEAVATVAGREAGGASETEVLRLLQREESLVLARHLAGAPRGAR